LIGSPRSATDTLLPGAIPPESPSRTFIYLPALEPPNGHRACTPYGDEHNSVIAPTALAAAATSLRSSQSTASVTAAFATPALTAFFQGDSRDHESRERVSPPPAEESIRSESNEQRH